jgi:hypothetical protein
VANQHFQLWTKNEAMIGKTKLWGRIEQALPAGNYSLVVQDNYQIGSLKLQKGIQLVVSSRLGGPLYFYPITFLIFALACIAYALFIKYDIG